MRKIVKPTKNNSKLFLSKICKKYFFCLKAWINFRKLSVPVGFFVGSAFFDAYFTHDVLLEGGGSDAARRFIGLCGQVRVLEDGRARCVLVRL